MKRVAIIGGGSWGTALSIILARTGHSVRLWVFEKELVAEINQDRRNSLYMGEFSIPPGVEASNSIEFCLQEAEMVLTVIPSHHCRSVFGMMLPYLRPEMVFISATKGLESGTWLRMSEVIQSVLPPTFAENRRDLRVPLPEVAEGTQRLLSSPARTGRSPNWFQRISGPSLRLYTNTDVAGVELGGAVKTLLHWPRGLCRSGLWFELNGGPDYEGLGRNDSPGSACGENETLAGLTGLGDLVLTCIRRTSRNRSVGFNSVRTEAS